MRACVAATSVGRVGPHAPDVRTSRVVEDAADRDRVRVLHDVHRAGQAPPPVVLAVRLLARERRAERVGGVGESREPDRAEGLPVVGSEPSQGGHASQADTLGRSGRPDFGPGDGRMDRVPLYRDEAIVLRTHKLGEADRIITLLTRQHGRVRAVAKGVRKTTSRWGSRLEPFTHVDLQLAEGRNLDVITQADTLDAVPVAARRPLRPLHRRHRDARDRRPAGHRGEAALAPAVPAARRRAAGDDLGGARRRPRCSTPTCCARWPWPATPRRSPTAPAAATRARTGGSRRRPAGRCAPTAGCPAPRRRRPGTLEVMGALLAGDWPIVDRRRPAPPARGLAGWSRRSCTGTSSAGCARWSTSRR